MLAASLTPAEARAVISSMKSNGFIDKQTRAVIVEFSSYNPLTRYFNVPRLMFEVSETGAIYTQVTNHP